MYRQDRLKKKHRLDKKFTSEKASTCGDGLKVAKLVVAFSSTLHPYGVLPHIPPALLVVCGLLKSLIHRVVYVDLIRNSPYICVMPHMALRGSLFFVFLW
jgi:hypothetical protein